MGNVIDKILGIDIKKISIKCWCCTKSDESDGKSNMEDGSRRRSFSDMFRHSDDDLLRKVSIILILHKQGKVADNFDDRFCRDIYAIVLHKGDVTRKQSKSIDNIYRKFHIKQKKKKMNYSELYGLYQDNFQ